VGPSVGRRRRSRDTPHDREGTVADDDATSPSQGGAHAGASTSADDPVATDGSGSSGSPIDELGEYIRHQRESARLSLRKLAKIAGVSNPYLSQIERGLRKPSAEILQAIAKALEISSETLYVKAGILEEREHDLDLEAVVAQDPHLTDPQRQALIEMYRSFRRLAELQDGRGSWRRGLRDVVSVGSVDDEAIRAASHRDEDASA
jgi:transcriptional regulator with XRE-family HTH domain